MVNRTPETNASPLSPPDPVALTHLRTAIRNFVQSRVKDAALAEDIAQETLVRLHRKFDTLRAGDKLEAWVFQITRNAKPASPPARVDRHRAEITTQSPTGKRPGWNAGFSS